MTASSSLSSSPERPESYQPHHSSLHLSMTGSASALSTSATERLAVEDGIAPVHSSSQTAKASGASKKRRRAVMACLAIPVTFYAIYGAVASTQDLIVLLRDGNEAAPNDQAAGDETMTTAASSAGRAGASGADLFDGTITAETPAQHDLAANRPTNPLFALLTGATLQPTSKNNAVGLSSYLSSVVSPHSKYNRRTHLPVLWTPGAPNYGFLVTKMYHCLDVTQASYLGRTEEGTYWDDLRVLQRNDEENKGRYVDVDMSTLHGVQRARDQNLVDSGLTDIIISPFLPEILDLFTSASNTNHHQPRLLIVLQDTKARIKASYTYLHGQNLLHASYLEFISSPHILVNDYLVRMLSGRWDVTVELTKDDLHVAVQGLQSKFHVGVQRHVQPYMAQMVELFGWQSPSPHEDVVDCMFPVKFDEARQPPYPQPKPADETELETQMREIVHHKNRWDVQLLEMFAKRWDEGVFTHHSM
mmetsp:Transcript_13510/g.38656  ORF Transcript_13510/g.38656 Transcript_13510/m.38656 type:complete len:475 (+) Transcript_13510:240-1664(+)